MTLDLNAIRNETRKGLNADEDLSHLTEELVLEAREQDAWQKLTPHSQARGK